MSSLGYDLMDRKRNILVREMFSLIEQANRLRDEVDKTFSEAYKALEKANITLGVIETVAESVPIENGISITYKSVMGVEIPKVSLLSETPVLYYGLNGTNSMLDRAYICFHRVKLLTAVLAEVENSVYRLAVAIKKTVRRANALKNVVIPDLKTIIKYISDSLEEKEREEFSRLKVIKRKERNP